MWQLDAQTNKKIHAKDLICTQYILITMVIIYINYYCVASEIREINLLVQKVRFYETNT